MLALMPKLAAPDSAGATSGVQGVLEEVHELSRLEEFLPASGALHVELHAPSEVERRTGEVTLIRPLAVCVPAWAGHRRRAAVRRRAKNRLDLGSGDQQAGIAREFRSPAPPPPPPPAPRPLSPQPAARTTASTAAAPSLARRPPVGSNAGRRAADPP